MKKHDEVDYIRATQDFDKAHGKKPDGFTPLKHTAEADGGVDYLKISREYEKYLITDQSEVVRNGKR